MFTFWTPPQFKSWKLKRRSFSAWSQCHPASRGLLLKEVNHYCIFFFFLSSLMQHPKCCITVLLRFIVSSSSVLLLFPSLFLFTFSLLLSPLNFSATAWEIFNPSFRTTICFYIQLQFHCSPCRWTDTTTIYKVYFSAFSPLITLTRKIFNAT